MRDPRLRDVIAAHYMSQPHGSRMMIMIDQVEEVVRIVREHDENYQRDRMGHLPKERAEAHLREKLRAAITAYNPNERLTAPTDEMIEAGCEAMRKMSDEMLARERSDKPEEMPDYDEGDLCRSIYVAMCAAAQAPQVNPNERLREALEPFARIGDNLTETGGWADSDEIELMPTEGFRVLDKIPVSAFRKARAALASTSPDAALSHKE